MFVVQNYVPCISLMWCCWFVKCIPRRDENKKNLSFHKTANMAVSWYLKNVYYHFKRLCQEKIQMHECASGQLDCYVTQLCPLYFLVQIYAVEFQNKQDSRPNGSNLIMHSESGTVPLILVYKGFSVFFWVPPEWLDSLLLLKCQVV